MVNTPFKISLTFICKTETVFEIVHYFSIWVYVDFFFSNGYSATQMNGLNIKNLHVTYMKPQKCPAAATQGWTSYISRFCTEPARYVNTRQEYTTAFNSLEVTKCYE